MTRVLITGASGFVGRHLLPRLTQAGYGVSTAGRNRSTAPPYHGVANSVVGEIGPKTDWAKALVGCETVVHLAAQVPARGVPAERYHIVNDQGTERLARQAVSAGVNRLIVLSSIFAARPGQVDGNVRQTHYGMSKQAAELHTEAFAGGGRIAVALRPPLVYGTGAVGNWKLLTRIASSGLPLPFGSVHNKRSVIAVENLVDAILAVVAAAADTRLSGTFNVADDGPVSLVDIISWLRAGMGRSAGLIPVPRRFLHLGLTMLGQTHTAQSLLGDLTADVAPFKTAFGWSPFVRSEDAIKRQGAAIVQPGRARI